MSMAFFPPFCFLASAQEFGEGCIIDFSLCCWDTQLFQPSSSHRLVELSSTIPINSHWGIISKCLAYSKVVSDPFVYSLLRNQYKKTWKDIINKILKRSSINSSALTSESHNRNILQLNEWGTFLVGMGSSRSIKWYMRNNSNWPIPSSYPQLSRLREVVTGAVTLPQPSYTHGRLLWASSLQQQHAIGAWACRLRQDQSPIDFHQQLCIEWKAAPWWKGSWD